MLTSNTNSERNMSLFDSRNKKRNPFVVNTATAVEMTEDLSSSPSQASILIAENFTPTQLKFGE